MANPPLHAPWRMDYIRSLEKPDAGKCFLCEAAAADPSRWRERLVLWKSDHCVVMINCYPYTNGHLLVSPLAHKPELDQLSAEEVTDLQIQTVAAIGVLKRAISPQGFNVGINIGRCAGAGVPGHLHQHIVPRWAGDTNFISVVGEVRVIPQAVGQLYDELIRASAGRST